MSNHVTRPLIPLGKRPFPILKSLGGDSAKGSPSTS
uniref:Uncharacterized protein n=1 Tax=Anguilla anguilla TaxID=7936 RepID=A0A0E9VTX2_ANGAN